MFSRGSTLLRFIHLSLVNKMGILIFHIVRLQCPLAYSFCAGPGNGSSVSSFYLLAITRICVNSGSFMHHLLVDSAYSLKMDTSFTSSGVLNR